MFGFVPLAARGLYADGDVVIVYFDAVGPTSLADAGPALAAKSESRRLSCRTWPEHRPSDPGYNKAGT